MANNDQRAAVIIPTYNEAKNIGQVLSRLFAQADKLPFSLTAIIVDDGSPDGTARIARNLTSPNRPVVVICREGKLGLGGAYRTGLKKALQDGFAFIFTMDGDGSHRPEQITGLAAALKQGADLVVGSRYAGGSIANWSWLRRLISRGANLIAGFFLGMRISDVTSGFRAYRASALQKIDLDGIKSEGYSFLEEMLYEFHRRGCQIREVPIRFEERAHGRSKLSYLEIPKYFLTMIRLRRSHRESRQA